MYRFIIFIAIFISLFSVCRAEESKQHMVRVHLFSTSKSVNVAPTTGFMRIESSEGERCSVKNCTEFKNSKDNILCGKMKPAERFTLTQAENMPLELNGKRYTGSLNIVKNGKYFIVVNVTDIESYLEGVLGGEVPASWPQEVLKAQAVAARTYAYIKTKTPRHKEFDLFSTTQDQVYKGDIENTKSIIDAVQATQGELLFYEDNPAETFFHSSCGGHTCDSGTVFNVELPYLSGVKCDYCSDVPTDWRCEIDRDTLSKLLISNGVIKEELKDLKIDQVDASGRASELVAITANDKIKIRGADLRLMIGAGKQRSTLYTLKAYSKSGEPSEVNTLNLKLYTDDGTPISECNLNIDTEKQAKWLMDQLKKDPYLKLSIFPPIRMEATLTTVKTNNHFLFSGKGWGHGVGMCQWGACGMAKRGSSYTQILEHYYPKCRIEKLSNISPIENEQNKEKIDENLDTKSVQESSYSNRKI